MRVDPSADFGARLWRSGGRPTLVDLRRSKPGFHHCLGRYDAHETAIG